MSALSSLFKSHKIERWRQDRFYAHIVPLFGIVFLLMILGFVIEPLPFFRDHEQLPWWRRKPDYWMLIVQVLVIGGMLIFWRKHYQLKGNWGDVLIGSVLGVLGIAIWIAPTYLYDAMGLTEDPESGWAKWIGVQNNEEGFNPSSVFTEGGLEWWGIVVIRFIRACIIVALAEEICWRGFLMRYVSGIEKRWKNNTYEADDAFWKIPFGTPSLGSYLISTLAFMSVHPPSYFIVAFLFGTLMYGLCVWRKSLLACVVMHGVANFVMGVYAMKTGNYGLW